MHELAVCQALIEQVEGVAREQQARQVLLIELGIGPLAGVEAQLLEQAYPIASAGSVAEGAELVINSLPVRVRCRKCGSSSDALPSRLTCADCGDWRTTLVSGDEMLLARVELIRETQNPEASLATAAPPQVEH